MREVWVERSGGYLGHSLIAACHVSKSLTLFFHREIYINGKLQMDSSFGKFFIFTLRTTKSRTEASWSLLQIFTHGGQSIVVDEGNVKNLILLSREKKKSTCCANKGHAGSTSRLRKHCRSQVCFLGSLTISLLQLRANPKAPVSLLQFLLNRTWHENRPSKRNLQNHPCTYMCSGRLMVCVALYKLPPLKWSCTKPLSPKCEPWFVDFCSVLFYHFF